MSNATLDNGEPHDRPIRSGVAGAQKKQNSFAWVCVKKNCEYICGRMLKTGNKFALGLLAAFILRLLVLNGPGFRAIEPLSRGILPVEIVSVVDHSLTQLSTLPAPDLNFPMVKESEEELKELLSKVIKYPQPLLIFIFCFGITLILGSSRSLTEYIERRRLPRLYLSFSVLRI